MKRIEKDSLTRIAIINEDKCKPLKCGLQCKKSCPVVLNGKLCIEVTKKSKTSVIYENLCIGCGICVNKCPFGAIEILNIPTSLNKDTVHRYSTNGFKLHRLPMPKKGTILGLLGSNGTGKSTALKILSLKLKPNFGEVDMSLEDFKLSSHFKGTELQNYFDQVTKVKKIILKPQYVDALAKQFEGRKVSSFLSNVQTNKHLINTLNMDKLMDRTVDQLSGGELQRFAICAASTVDTMVYMFDEPSSYLDIKQRLIVADVIKSLSGENKYVICVEHDLCILDYLSDFICVLYGTPGSYGVITLPYSVGEGINVFLNGFIPTENMRFRPVPFTFKISETFEDDIKRTAVHNYPAMIKTYNNFKLTIEAGSYNSSEIIVLLGENGTGKTTFIKLLAGLIKPDDEDNIYLPKLSISYKPQTINPKFDGTVQEIFYKLIKDSLFNPLFKTNVVEPLNIEYLLDKKIKEISGGELQRVALILALGKPADIYLIDEPSAYLDAEQRILISKIIKKFVMCFKKTAFIVEHDFTMATYLADKVILFNGTPSVECVSSSPKPLLTGMNDFLKILGITFRQDRSNYRPRINKLNSVNDREQKESGNYFFLG